MKHSEIIRAAMQYLEHSNRVDNEEYSSEFVCDCIRHVGRVNNFQFKATEIINDINILIDYKFSIDRWLVDVVGVDRHLIWNEGYTYFKQNTAAMQDYRLAWMEHMAQEYEAKGL